MPDEFKEFAILVIRLKAITYKMAKNMGNKDEAEKLADIRSTCFSPLVFLV